MALRRNQLVYMLVQKSNKVIFVDKLLELLLFQAHGFDYVVFLAEVGGLLLGVLEGCERDVDHRIKSLLPLGV